MNQQRLNLDFSNCQDHWLLALELPNEKEETFFSFETSKFNQPKIIFYRGLKELNSFFIKKRFTDQDYLFKAGHLLQETRLELVPCKESDRHLPLIYIKQVPYTIRVTYSHPGYQSLENTAVDFRWLRIAWIGFCEMMQRQEEWLKLIEEEVSQFKMIPCLSLTEVPLPDIKLIELPDYLNNGDLSDLLPHQDVSINRFDLLRLKHLPYHEENWELDVEFINTIVEASDQGELLEQPYYPRLLYITSSEDSEKLELLLYREDETRALQEFIYEYSLKVGYLPQKIIVSEKHSPYFEAILSNFFNELKVDLKPSSHLNCLETLRKVDR